MPQSRQITRRAFGAMAVGAATLPLAGRSALAQPPTPESAMGPFYPVRQAGDMDWDMTHLAGRRTRAAGQVIEITGRLLDVRGRPIANGQVDIWQANAAGRYAHPLDVSTAPLDPNFQGFARLRTRADGEWRIRTVLPAGYDSPIGHRPPHIHFDVSGRSHRLVAQMYFPENEAANAADTLYRQLGADGPRSVAQRQAAGRYRWDIILIEGA